MITTKSNACIPHLYVKKTNILNPENIKFDFYGLFSSKSLTKGDFIGLYSGDWYEEPIQLSEEESLYSVSTGDYVIVPEIDDNGRPNPERFPIAMANEPPIAKRANAQMVSWKIDGKYVQDSNSDEKYTGFGLIACRNIHAHTEIVWYYGDEYSQNRKYNVGKGCRVNVAGNVAQHPQNILKKIPRNSVNFYIQTPVPSSDERNSESDSDSSSGYVPSKSNIPVTDRLLRKRKHS